MFSYKSGILSHSCLVYYLGCLPVQGLHCHFFLFIMHQTVSMGDRSGLQAGQSGNHILLLQCNSVVRRTECRMAPSCWNKQ